MKGGGGVLVNVRGGPGLMLFEVEQAANRIRAEVDPDANIIFGNTILDDMEGRIRVSVVATGIDAEQLVVSDKVQPLRPHLKPVPLKVEPKPEPRAIAGATAVHRQHEAIADELGAQMPARPQTPIEAMILGGEEAPQIDEVSLPAEVPVRVASAPRMEPVRMPVSQAEPERRFLGLFGRKKKDEPRLDATTRPPAPRPAAQAMVRPPVAAGEAVRPQQQLQNTADDLFPDHKRDEQFEIPAFLRRQTN